jgi:hypothetical protein
MAWFLGFALRIGLLLQGLLLQHLYDVQVSGSKIFLAQGSLFLSHSRYAVLHLQGLLGAKVFIFEPSWHGGLHL